MKLRQILRANQSQPAPAPEPVAPGDYGMVAYSQEGEDVVLRRFVGEKTDGFYIDIGAHHPERFSNTYYYYQRGWRGLNVDADPDLMAEFDRTRSRDVNVAKAVGSKSDALIFYVFNERAINTFDKKLADERSQVEGWKIIEERKIEVEPLAAILAKHLTKNQKIDFMSVDVEGKDMDVLQSNNWSKYRPGFLMVECYDLPTLSNVAKDPMVMYLQKQGYVPVAKTLFTVLFANTDTYGKK